MNQGSMPTQLGANHKSRNVGLERATRLNRRRAKDRVARRFKESLHLGRTRTESGDRSSTSSIAGILKTLKAMGCTSLGPQLSFIGIFSFFSGLAQASILVIISEFAVNSAQGKTHLVVYGHSVSIDEAIVLCIVLLFIYSGAGIAASVGTSYTYTRTVASIRAKIINAFFRTSWRIQSQERLGHVQQLLSLNCDKAAEITFAMAVGAPIPSHTDRATSCCILGKPTFRGVRPRLRTIAVVRPASLQHLGSQGF